MEHVGLWLILSWVALLALSAQGVWSGMPQKSLWLTVELEAVA